VDIALKLIEIYQRYLSPLTPPSCRFYPTCSHYTYGAISRFGLIQGIRLGLKRLCKCHPFHPGGYDPVPELPSLTSQLDMLKGLQSERAEQIAETDNQA
jgi:putative membrane protein insertion efficiency factor